MFEVCSLPVRDKDNKYFELWRGALERTGRVTFFDVPLWRFAVGRKVAGRLRVVCVHWSTVLYGSAWAPVSVVRLFGNLAALVLVRLRGGAVVWVIHNAHAHDYPHPRIDALGRVLLAHVASAFIAQQESTECMLAARYPRVRVAYMPHGNYIGAYGARADRTTARRQFGFAEGEVVLLSLGAVRPYKRLEKLIDVVCSSADPRLRLWIVGKDTLQYAESLRARAKGDARVRIDTLFVPDSDVSTYLAAADYSAFYYDDSELTSGGIVLSLSYGVPVLTRDIASAELVGKDGGCVFTSDAQLQEILTELPARHFDEGAVVGRVAPHTWERIAEKTIDLYTSLI